MKYFSIITLITMLLFSGCAKGILKDKTQKETDQEKKVLIIHSYHSDSRRVMEHNESIEKILKENGIKYDFFYMDTQRNRDEEFIKKAATEAKNKIEEYKPDVIITFDDNAFKYLVMQYYRDSEINVIFAGLDWDVSAYDAPYTNTTGMISVTLMEQLIDYLKEYADGEKVSWLGYDTLTSRKEINAYLNVLGINMNAYFVENFSEWKDSFLKIQKEADILIHSGTLTSMKEWNEKEASDFVLQNIEIPIGTVNKSIMNCSIMGLVVVPTEQGIWVAEKAVEIINGRSVSDIPVTHNKEGEIYLNLEIAEKLNILFNHNIIRSATIYSFE